MTYIMEKKKDCIIQGFELYKYIYFQTQNKKLILCNLFLDFVF